MKLRENQAKNLSWNLVPRPISILRSPEACLTLPRMFPFKYQNRNISVYKDASDHIAKGTILWFTELHGTYFFIQWVACGKYRLSLFCITLKWAKPSHNPLPLASRDSPPFCKSCDQCWKFQQVRRSEANNFGGGPGTFCWFFFNFVLMICDSRHEDLQLFWLSFKHCMWHLDPLWLAHWPSFRGRSLAEL